MSLFDQVKDKKSAASRTSIPVVSIFKIIKRAFFLALFVFFQSSLFAQITVDAASYTVAGTYTWTVPACVTSIQVECFGAGGGGGGNNSENWGASGGGGGAYSSGIITVTPGQTYTLVIGAGGSGGAKSNTATSNGQAGFDTYFTDGTTTYVLAKGGSGGNGAYSAAGTAGGQTGGALGGAGGSAASCIGTTIWTGGTGGNGNYGGGTKYGGGGGGSGGRSGIGGNGKTGWGNDVEENGVHQGFPPGGAAPGGGVSGGYGGSDGDKNGPPNTGTDGGGGGGGGSSMAGATGGTGTININWGRFAIYNASNTWTCPANITSAIVQCWGAGGGSGGATLLPNNNDGNGGAGGGGGGAYSYSVIQVTAGVTYTLNIGVGGTGGASSNNEAVDGSPGQAGGDTWFGSSTTILAKGGSGGGGSRDTRTPVAVGGTGGAAASGTGQLVYSGGNGGAGCNCGWGAGGGGGSSAGTAANGNNGGSVPTGGSCVNGTATVGGAGGGAPTGGSAGGGGTDDWGLGWDASSFGGGAGGAAEMSNGFKGAAGQVIVGYEEAVTITNNGSQVSANQFCVQTPGVLIHSVELTGNNEYDPSCRPIDITGFDIVTTGTYNASDVQNLNLYYTTTNAFSVSTATLLATIVSPTTAGTQTFPAFNLHLGNNSYYFWVTVDVTSSLGGNRTIAVNATTPSDVTSTILGNSIVRTNVGGYGSASASQTFLPTPILSSTLTPPAICSGTAFTYTATSTTSGSSFAWSRASITAISQAGTTGTGNVSEVLTNTTTAIVNVTYVYTTTASGCSNTGQNVIVPVDPTPVLSSTLTPPSICTGSTFSYTATSATTGSTFKWSRATIAGITQAGTTGTGNVGEVLTNTTTAAINVTYLYTTTANTCSDAAQNVIVTVNPTPVLSSTLSPAAFCSATTFSYTATSATAGATFSWTRGSVTGITPSTNSGTGNISEALTNTTTASINVTYLYTTTANTCSDAAQNVIVTVNPTPVLSSTLSPAAFCSATTFNYTATSATAGATFSWTRGSVTGITPATNSGTSNISEALTNTTTASINVTYLYTTTANTCSDAAQNVIVTVNPTPVLSSTLSPAAICSATSFNYTATSATAGATFAWSRATIAGITQAGTTGNGNVSEILTNTTTATINVTYLYTTTANTCSDATQNVIVTVNPTPVLSSTLSPAAICSATIFNYTATSATAGATFSWTRGSVTGITPSTNSGTGNVSETLTNTSTAPLNVTYIYTTSANGCNNAPGQNVILTVNPTPVLSSTLTPGAICSGTTFNYTATSATAGATFSWTRGSVTGITPSTNSGTGNVSEALTNTTTAPINVTYLYITTANTCSDAVQNVIVTVNPTPMLSSTLTPATICSNATFTYTPSGTVAGSTFTWSRAVQSGISEAANSGSGSVSETLINTTLSLVNVTYVYTSSANGCSNNQNVVVPVYPAPQGSFTGNSRCISNPAELGLLTWTATAGTGNYTLDFSPGSVVQSSVVSGTSFSVSPAGTPTVTTTYTLTQVTDNNGCISTGGFTSGTATITVTGAAVSQTAGTPSSATTCAGVTASYHVQALNVNTYEWEVSTNGGSTFTLINSAGSGPIYANYTTSTLLVDSATVADSGYMYRAILIPACGPPLTSDTAVLTVNPIPKLTSPMDSALTICSGTNVIYTPTSNVPASSYAWTRSTVAGISEAGTTGAGSINEPLTNTTTSPINVTYDYIITANQCNSSSQNVIVTVNPNANIVLSSTVGTDSQKVCLNEIITPITYSINQGATGATIAGLPTGLSGAYSPGSYTISGTPTEQGVYDYTITTTGPCVQTSITGTVTVGLTLTSAAGTNNQSVCDESPIAPITYAIGGGAPTTNGLPPGVSGVYSAGVLTISGTPAVNGTYDYTVNSSAACVTPTSITGTITVGLGLASGSGDTTQAVCLGTPITNIVMNVVGTGASISGGSLPPGVNGNYSGGQYTISGTPSVDGTYAYTVTTSGSCAMQSSITGTLTVGLGLASGSGDTTQAVCLGTPITNIVMNVVGTGASISGGSLPPGVNGNYSGGQYTISGTPSVDGTYAYTVTTSGSCAMQSSITGTLTVGLGLASGSGDTTQAVCLGTPITNIVMNVVGTGASISGGSLPPGVNGNYSGGQYTISGTPSVDGTYAYTVTTSGSCAMQSSITGTLTVGLGLASGSGDTTQAVCLGTPITNIVMNVVGTGASISGGSLPPGVNGNYSGGQYTISGTPSVDGTYAYTVTTSGSCAMQSSITGTLTVGLGLASGSGDTTQAVCLGTPITNIVMNVVGTGASISGGSLPPGVNGNYSGGQYTISGTPSVDGTYAYTVTTSGSCAMQSSITGTLTVGLGLASGSGDTTQAVCLGTPITNIVMNVVGTGASISGGSLPPGVNGNYSGGQYTISGTPSVDGTYAYTVTTSGSCAMQSSITGTLTVGLGLASGSGDTTQAVCLGTPITNIVMNVVGTGASISGGSLPPGVNGNYSGGQYTISGTPSVDGTYAYTVTTSGSCAMQSSITGTLTVGLGLASGSGDTTQAVCLGTPITNIVMNVVGTGASISGGSLPPGVNGNYSGGQYTISGTPSVDGTYAYTVTTSGSCAMQSSITGTLTVGLGLASGSGDTTQAVCLGTPITNIVMNVVGTGASISGGSLPPGVNGNYSGGQYTISGTPSVDGTYAYTVTTSGSCAMQSSITGTLTVGLGLASGSGDTTQAVCLGTPITNIVMNVVGTGASISGGSLPPGVNGNYSGGQYTISGTPSVDGTYAYTVTTSGSCAMQSSITGTLTVGLGLASGSGDTTQAVCLGTPITNIVMNVVGTGASISGGSLPPGVNGNYSGGQYTISGTPSVDGTYAYTVTTSGSCAMQSSITGTLTVGLGLASGSGDTTQAVCLGTPITNIVMNVVGTGASISGGSLPPGVNGNYSGGQYTISGTPSVDGTYAYTVTTSGSCAMQSSITGTLTVGLGLASNSDSLTQNVCNDVAIGNIIFNVVGGGATVTSTLPPGVTGSNTGSQFIISGTPTVNGTYAYTVSTTGSCATSTYTGTITVGLGLASNSDSLTQNVCNDVAIGNIIFNVAGGGAVVTATLPLGVSGSYNPATQQFTISGTPTVQGVYEYTVSTSGSCAIASYTGTITVGIGLAPGSGSLTQTVCNNQAIVPIVMDVAGGSPTLTGSLPTNVTGIYNPGTKQYIISGTPTSSSSFTVTTTGCATPSGLAGSITLKNDVAVLLTSAPGTANQTICGNQAMNMITYSITGVTTAPTVSGLPAGLNPSYNAGILSITGTPAASVQAGVYTSIFSAQGTCGAKTDTFTITIIKPIAAFTPDSVNGTIPLPVNFANNSQGATSYKWNFGSDSLSGSTLKDPTTVVYKNQGIYTVKLVASSGLCSDSTTVKITAYKWIVPNVFTPNGDGVNDIFGIWSIGITNTNGEIYDRWGAKLYQWSSVTGGWDGVSMTTNLECPPGPYYFIITITDINNKVFVEKGYLQLIR